MSLIAFALAAFVASAQAASDTPLTAGAHSQPSPSAADCAVKDAGHTVCLLRARTVGRYLIHVEGTSTPTGLDATQSIGILGAKWACGQAESKPGAWPGGARTVTADCTITVLTASPVEINAVFGGAEVSLDAAGPQVTIQRLPSDGVLADPMRIGIKPGPAK